MAHYILLRILEHRIYRQIQDMHARYKREQEAHRLFPKLRMFPLSISGGRNWTYFWDSGLFSILPYLGRKYDHLKVLYIHVVSFYPGGGGNYAYFHFTGSSFREMVRFSEYPYFVMKIGHWQKFQKLQIYSLFTTEGRNSCFNSTCRSFRDTDWFSKLQHLGMKLVHQQKFQKLCICSLSTPSSRNWAYIFALWAEIWSENQNCHMGMKLAMATCKRSRNCSYCDAVCFYPRVSKLSFPFFLSFYCYYFFYSRGCLGWQWFLRYRLIFKIAIFGHATWPLAKSSRSYRCSLFLPQGIEIELIFGVSKYRLVYKMP